MYLQGHFSGQYYILGKDELALGCKDDQCKKCNHRGLRETSDEECQRLGEASSYHLRAPDINLWIGNGTNTTHLISNTFYFESCSFNKTHIKPQWLSLHANIVCDDSNDIRGFQCEDEENFKCREQKVNVS